VEPASKVETAAQEMERTTERKARTQAPRLAGVGLEAAVAVETFQEVSPEMVQMEGLAVPAWSSSTTHLDMAATRHAIVRNGVVEQITLWDPVNAPGWKPPQGSIAVACPDDLHLGATYDGQYFTNPPSIPNVPPPIEPVGQDGLTDDERKELKRLIKKSHGNG